jgi:hypothetical protein
LQSLLAGMSPTGDGKGERELRTSVMEAIALTNSLRESIPASGALAPTARFAASSLSGAASSSSLGSGSSAELGALQGFGQDAEEDPLWGGEDDDFGRDDSHGSYAPPALPRGVLTGSSERPIFDFDPVKFMRANLERYPTSAEAKNFEEWALGLYSLVSDLPTTTEDKKAHLFLTKLVGSSLQTWLRLPKEGKTLREAVLDLITMVTPESSLSVRDRHDVASMKQNPGETRFSFYTRYMASELARGRSPAEQCADLCARFEVQTRNMMKYKEIGMDLAKLLHFVKLWDERDAKSSPRTVVAAVQTGQWPSKKKGQKQFKQKPRFQGNCSYCGIFGHKEKECNKKAEAESHDRTSFFSAGRGAGRGQPQQNFPRQWQKQNQAQRGGRGRGGRGRGGRGGWRGGRGRRGGRGGGGRGAGPAPGQPGPQVRNVNVTPDAAQTALRAVLSLAAGSQPAGSGDPEAQQQSKKRRKRKRKNAAAGGGSSSSSASTSSSSASGTTLTTARPGQASTSSSQGGGSG